MFYIYIKIQKRKLKYALNIYSMKWNIEGVVATECQLSLLKLFIYQITWKRYKTININEGNVTHKQAPNTEMKIKNKLSINFPQ